jgi:hypothetical protein
MKKDIINTYNQTEHFKEHFNEGNILTFWMELRLSDATYNIIRPINELTLPLWQTNLQKI